MKFKTINPMLKVKAIKINITIDKYSPKKISNILGVNVEPATINGGTPFVSSGMLTNNNAIVVGNLTTGPEIMMLTRVFTN